MREIVFGHSSRPFFVVFAHLHWISQIDLVVIGQFLTDRQENRDIVDRDRREWMDQLTHRVAIGGEHSLMIVEETGAHQ